MHSAYFFPQLNIHTASERPLDSLHVTILQLLVCHQAHSILLLMMRIKSPRRCERQHRLGPPRPTFEQPVND